MELIIDHIGSITVVTYPDANLDASNIRDFKEAINPVLVQETQIIFDMSRIHFVDSHGLGALMLCLRQSEVSGGIIKLCSLSPSVHSLFEQVRLHKVFDIYETREEAIQAF